MAAEELETIELLLTDTYRGTEPDDAGAFLRRVPVRARHQVRIVHPCALGAQCGRHECRAGADHGGALGAKDVRARYFLGSQLARDLRALPGKEFSDVHKSYGPRSYLYAEMVFGNTINIKRLIASTPQMSISAMRTPRPLTLAEIVERTGLPADEVRRFNPAPVERVPAHATLYLPNYVSEFGPDVAFWRRPPSPSYVAVLNDFMRLDSGPERWDDPAFAPVLKDVQRRFRETNTEEGTVMETVLAYAMDQAYASTRRTLLSEYRNSEKVRSLVERGVLRLDAMRNARTSGVAAATVQPVAYGSESTSTGSTSVARRAGATHATSATTPVSAATVPSSSGSVGVTPKTSPVNARLMRTAPARPRRSPPPMSVTPSFSTR